MKRFLVAHGVLVVVMVAAGVRISYVAFAKRGPCAITLHGQVLGTYHSQCTGAGAGKANDQVYYNAASNQIANGKWFTDPFHAGVETADHPPLTALVLSAVSVAFDHRPLSWLADSTNLAGRIVYTHVREQRYFMALLGTLNVFLIMVLARRVAKRGVAIVAGAFAALYPFIWVNDGLLFSETVAITCALLALLAAIWCANRPSVLRFALAGALCAVAAMARAELLLLAPLLVLAIAWWSRQMGARRVIASVAAGAVACIAVLAPWFAYNASRFHDRVLISTNDGYALAGSNCDSTYHGSEIGLWSIVPPCAYTDQQLAAIDAAQYPRTHHHLDQSEVSTVYRQKATTYIRHHLGWLPVVVAARLGRAWNVYRPFDMVTYNQGESRERWVTELGLIAYYPLLLLAIAGVVALVRERGSRAVWILLVPAISVTFVSAATYGQTRLRATAEPSLVVLAAVGAAMLAARWRGRGATAAAEVPAPLP